MEDKEKWCTHGSVWEWGGGSALTSTGRGNHAGTGQETPQEQCTGAQGPRGVLGTH